MYKRLSVIILSLLYITLCYSQDTSVFQNALIKLYPDAANVIWNQKSDYHVATFTRNDYEMEVWMNDNAEWIMSVYDIEDLDELPPDVYNVFTFTQYSQWNVTNVFWVTFPNMQEQFIIKVNQDNSSSKCMLFFTASGEELQTIDNSYSDIKITPRLFDIK
jgi:Protein of unknown function (DUF2874).